MYGCHPKIACLSIKFGNERLLRLEMYPFLYSFCVTYQTIKKYLFNFLFYQKSSP
eukprot:UN26242